MKIFTFIIFKIKCKHCYFEKEEVFRLKKIKKLTCQLFKFQHNSKCYCFCLVDIYQWFYGSEDPQEKLLRNTHPTTRKEVADKTLKRLKKDYVKFYKMESRPKSYTDAEYKNFREGVSLFKTAMETSLNVQIYFSKAIDLYLEDIFDLIDDEDELRKNKDMAVEMTKEFKK